MVYNTTKSLRLFKHSSPIDKANIWVWCLGPLASAEIGDQRLSHTHTHIHSSKPCYPQLLIHTRCLLRFGSGRYTFVWTLIIRCVPYIGCRDGWVGRVDGWDIWTLEVLLGRYGSSKLHVAPSSKKRPRVAIGHTHGALGGSTECGGQVESCKALWVP